MVVDSAGTEVERSRKELTDLREKLRNLLQSWELFLYTEDLISEYVLLLLRNVGCIHKTRSQVDIDLEILRDLLANLEHERAEAEKNYFSAQLSFVYAQRKEAMLQQELKRVLEDHTEISNAFREWIEQQLDGEDWNDMLQFTLYRENVLIEQANAKGDGLKEHPISTECFEVDKPELIMEQWTACQEEIATVTKKKEETLYACAQIPSMCASIERLMLFLENIDDSIYERRDVHHSMHPHDGAKEVEKSQDVQHPMHPDVGVKELEQAPDL